MTASEQPPRAVTDTGEGPKEPTSLPEGATEPTVILEEVASPGTQDTRASTKETSAAPKDVYAERMRDITNRVVEGAILPCELEEAAKKDLEVVAKMAAYYNQRFKDLRYLLDINKINKDIQRLQTIQREKLDQARASKPEDQESGVSFRPRTPPQTVKGIKRKAAEWAAMGEYDTATKRLEATMKANLKKLGLRNPPKKTPTTTEAKATTTTNAPITVASDSEDPQDKDFAEDSEENTDVETSNNTEGKRGRNVIQRRLESTPTEHHPKPKRACRKY